MNMFWPGLLAVAGSFLAFANPLARFPALILALPLGLALLARRAPSVREAFRGGHLAGVAAAACSLYWTSLPVHDYGGLPFAAAVCVPVLIGLVLGLYPAAYCAVLKACDKRFGPLGLGLLAGLLWANLEMAKGYLLTGFPWLTLTAALTPWPWAIQPASLIGAYGLAGVYACVGTWLAYAHRSRASALAAVSVLAGLFVLGQWQLDYRPQAKAGRAVSVLLVQGNVDQAQKWNPDLQSSTVELYRAPTLAASTPKEPMDLVIWPETSMPFFYQDGRVLTRRVEETARESGAWLLFGGPAYERRPGGPVLFNRAWLLSPGGQVKGSYDKEHLVPFGEYVPLGRLLSFVHKMVEGVGDFVPGTQLSPLVADNLALGVLICYEDIFPELAQNRVEAGSNVLVNISNDAWFGLSAAARQHLELSQLRAVEQHRFVLRGTNTGLSAVIDPYGRLVSVSKLGERAEILSRDVEPLSVKTPFHQIHDLLRIALPVFTVVWLAFGFLRASPNTQ